MSSSDDDHDKEAVVVVSLDDARKGRAPKKKRGGGSSGGGGDDGEDRGQWPDGVDCPVRPLGKAGGQFAFMSPAGEIAIVKPKDLASPPVIVALFDGDTRWLKKYFPSDRAAFSGGAAQQWLVQQCVKRRYFQAAEKLRGPGAWREPDGSLLLHLGHEIRVLRERRSPEVFDAGCERGPYIYPAAPAEPLPADVAASAEQVDELLTVLNSWRWGHVEDPRVLLGWLGCGYIAGALRWRPHIWVTGDTSTGKSTLEQLIRGLCGAGALTAADPTKMAIAMKLNGKACPVLLDEFERDIDAARQEAVVELARLASTDEQAGIIRGSPEGVVRTYRIRGTFYFSSMLRSPLKPQDRTRVHVADLNTLPPVTAETRPMLKTIKRLRETFGPALQARTLEGFWRFQANELVYEEAIIEIWRRGGRIVDQMGTLLAMAHTLLFDAVATADVAQTVLRNFEPGDIVGHDDENESHRCVRHILSSSVTDDSVRDKPQRSIAELITLVADASTNEIMFGGSEHNLLRRQGIAIVRMAKTGEIGVAFANEHQGLERLLAGTRWSDGVWNQVLRKLDGAGASKNAIQFAGHQIRASVVPRRSLPLGNGPDTPDVAVLQPSTSDRFET